MVLCRIFVKKITMRHSPLIHTKNVNVKQRRNIMASNDNNTSGRGTAGMDADTKQRVQSAGGKASSAKQDMSKLGAKGAEAQPREAKAKGGKNSHQGNS
jgi:hypothetical protein